MAFGPRPTKIPGYRLIVLLLEIKKCVPEPNFEARWRGAQTSIITIASMKLHGNG
jgi:hypothetical protein